jgi:hypothetical protein
VKKRSQFIRTGRSVAAAAWHQAGCRHTAEWNALSFGVQSSQHRMIGSMHGTSYRLMWTRDKLVNETFRPH